MTTAEKENDAISVVVQSLKKKVPKNIHASEIRKQYESQRPEVQITLSEEGSENDLALNGYNSSQVSPVKQEAPKACIMDMAKGSPAMGARHMYDNFPFGDVDGHLRSKSQSGLRKRGAGRSGTGDAVIKLMPAEGAADLDQVEIDLNTGYYMHNSSNSSNSSVCSEMLQMEMANGSIPLSKQVSATSRPARLNSQVRTPGLPSSDLQHSPEPATLHLT